MKLSCRFRMSFRRFFKRVVNIVDDSAMKSPYINTECLNDVDGSLPRPAFTDCQHIASTHVSSSRRQPRHQQLDYLM